MAVFTKYYKMIFEVTETCNNGNERTKKVSVYAPHCKDGKYFVDTNRFDKALKMLEAKHYYNIKYVDTTITELMITE